MAGLNLEEENSLGLKCDSLRHAGETWASSWASCACPGAVPATVGWITGVTRDSDSRNIFHPLL